MLSTVSALYQSQLVFTVGSTLCFSFHFSILSFETPHFSFLFSSRAPDFALRHPRGFFHVTFFTLSTRQNCAEVEVSAKTKQNYQPLQMYFCLMNFHQTIGLCHVTFQTRTCRNTKSCDGKVSPDLCRSLIPRITIYHIYHLSKACKPVDICCFGSSL